MSKRMSSAILGLTAICGGLAWAGTPAQADIAVIVNPLNQAALTQGQVKDLFLGKKARYPDASVAQPVDQVDGLPIRNDFYALLARKDESEMKAYWSTLIFTGNGRPPKAVGSDGEVIKYIKENPGGIGYIDSKQVDGAVKLLFILR